MRLQLTQKGHDATGNDTTHVHPSAHGHLIVLASFPIVLGGVWAGARHRDSTPCMSCRLSQGKYLIKREEVTVMVVVCGADAKGTKMAAAVKRKQQEKWQHLHSVDDGEGAEYGDSK